MGLFGLTIAEEYGGLGESLLTYALVVEQIARGWMCVSGVINTHFIVAYMITQHGTRRAEAAASAADGRPARSAARSRCASRSCGSDVAAIKTRAVAGRRRVRPRRPEDVADQRRARRRGRHPGQGRRGRRVGLQEHDDVPLEKEPGFGETRPGLTIPGKIEKMGYKGVETTEMVLDGVPGAGRRDPRRRGRPRPRLLPDDGRRRGRPGQRRRPRLRHLDPRLRARASRTPSSARRSASRSPTTRPSRSSSPRWRPRSRPRT